MGKHGQASSSWQRVVYARYALWRLCVLARTDRRRRRRGKKKKKMMVVMTMMMTTMVMMMT